MPGLAKFVVRAPAMRHDGTAVVIDNQSTYVGPVPAGPDGAPATVQNATVMGGVRQGDKLLSCTYITSLYPVPGLGDLHFE